MQQFGSVNNETHEALFRLDAEHDTIPSWGVSLGIISTDPIPGGLSTNFPSGNITQHYPEKWRAKGPFESLDLASLRDYLARHNAEALYDIVLAALTACWDEYTGLMRALGRM